jgi:hypothetical protein
MSILPRAAQPLLKSFAAAFTRPTFKRFLTLMLGAVLTTGRRTITNLLRAVRGLAPRTSLQLSPRLLPPPLVALDLGPRPGGHPPAALGAPGLRATSRR